MQQLTEQLLLLARIDADRLPLWRQAVDLDDIVMQTIARYEPGPDVVVEAAHAASPVAVALRREQDAAILTVDDDGPGIPPEARGGTVHATDSPLGGARFTVHLPRPESGRPSRED